jgi:(1->4)-alpha-D-glucan 1-alpha-D-glucosylmutase
MKTTRYAPPSSTYRLQLNPAFTLDDAAGISDYLCSLGVSHLYASPYLQAAPGSTHGYDVVDPRTISAELGGSEAHARLCRKLEACGMGQVLDIVPNHMSLARTNLYWWDVLENGPCSRFARYFDVAWEADEPHLRNKILVPILAGQYGRMLNDGKIKLVRDGSQFEIHYEEHRLPIAPSTLGKLLASAADIAGSDELRFLSHAFTALPCPTMSDVPGIEARHHDKSILLNLLQRLCAEDSKASSGIDRAIERFNASIDALDAFLNAQNYRLSWWHTGQQNLGYRRFFDVNSLVGVRVGDERVFYETHEIYFQWLRDGILSGVRVDHPDGLRDPKLYFDRLRANAPDAWIVVEKILAGHEALPSSWPVDGTTGYEFINQVNGLMISPHGWIALDRIYTEFTGQTANYAQICHDSKIEITQTTLGSDVNYLTSLFAGICESNREYRDYTRVEIRRAIREVAASFPVYRTYVSPIRDEVSADDVASIDRAIESAKSARTDVENNLFDFIRDVLLLHVKGERESEFVYRLQEFTGAVMAKGVEDTAFYCYNRLISVNEVGGNPGDPLISLAEFNGNNQRAQSLQPYRMVSLTTHDTKRSEDVRARLNALSEIPQAFADAVQRWSEMTRSIRSVVLDRNTEYLYYQTLIGAWPISIDRATTYMEKATREAKQQTSWTNPNPEFDEALRHFIRATLEHAPFVQNMEKFVAVVREAGWINSLSQTLLKCTVPGLPDTYQGSELWDLRLVDPDNRTPVDFTLRRMLLCELPSLKPEDIMQRMEEGAPKLWVIQRALTLRKERPGSFGRDGTYTPLLAVGHYAEHCIAFLRGQDVITIAPRLPFTLAGKWQETTLELPEGHWNNVLSGEVIDGGVHKLATLLSIFPVALLVREKADA